MTRKQTRTTIILASLAVLGLAAFLILTAIKDTVVFFYTPSEVQAKAVTAGTRLRLGGLVEQGSLASKGEANYGFVVTDLTATLAVNYKGQLPDLFREGQGVVAEGTLQADGTFTADTVLAKHDENYMPKDVADRLKAQGKWKEPTP